MPENADAIREHRITTPRSARYFTLGTPGPDVTDLWIACHGYGQLAADFLKGFEAIAAARRLIVAPEALSRFYHNDDDGRHGKMSRIGASWMTREDRLAEIEDYVRYLDALADMLRPQLAPGARLRVLGFSQGVSTVVRWIARGAVRPAQLILWAGEIPVDVGDATLGDRLRDVGVHIVSGARDRLASGSFLDRQQARLERSGIGARMHRFDGGHRLDHGVLASLAGQGS